MVKTAIDQHRILAIRHMSRNAWSIREQCKTVLVNQVQLDFCYIGEHVDDKPS